MVILHIVFKLQIIHIGLQASLDYDLPNSNARFSILIQIQSYKMQTQHLLVWQVYSSHSTPEAYEV